MAGFELTKEQAQNPSDDIIEKVRKLRVASIDKLCGHGAIVVAFLPRLFAVKKPSK